MEEKVFSLKVGLISCFEFLLKNQTTFYVLRIPTEAGFLLEKPNFLAEAMDYLTAECVTVLHLHRKRELFTHIPVVQAHIKHLTEQVR